MRKELVAVLVVAGAALGFAAGLAAPDDGTADRPERTERAGPGERVVVRYPDVPSKLRRWQDEVRTSGVLEDAADELVDVVALPDELTIEVTSCPEGTGYLTGEAVVELCLEDVVSTHDELAGAEVEDIDATLRGIWRETFFHESAHALVDLLDLPITGREENVADQFAAWRLGESGEEESVDALLSAAYEYGVLASSYEQDASDEHASDGARAVNYLCYLYGSDPDEWEELVDDDPLTRERADLCVDEWDRLRAGWRELLADAGALRS